jgi:outer membrane protein OmpA-like peptidoglycan-associated protein
VVHQLNYGQTDYRYSHPLSKSLLLNLEGGTNYAFSDYEDSDLGLMFGGGIEYYFPSETKSTFGLKINLAQQYISGSNNNLGLPTNFDTEIRKLGIGITYSYAATSVLLPFASIGGSYLWLGYDSEDVPSRFLDLSNGADKSSFILDGIIGLKYIVNELLAINFGIGYNYVNNDNIDATVYGDHEDFYLSGQIGFSFRIWNRKDTDGDGIIDDEDQCLYQEEDFDGYQDNDGCPDLDNDGDGIPDINDGCQNIPEDLDGFQDEDGCPDPDNDGDGIDDINDSCPDIKEDIDGYQDEDGCPDADNDGDGIVDEEDNCVDEAEVFNGYQDDDGCPDELPEPVYVEPEPVIQKPRPVVRKDPPQRTTPPAPRSFLVHSETTFGGDAAQIKSSAYAELDRIANELKKYPNTSWRIEGHTDKKESRSIANRITKSQADAILNYFISKGLSPANFQSVGFGDATPISSNTSVYGRMKNRRIIIRKID